MEILNNALSNKDTVKIKTRNQASQLLLKYVLYCLPAAISARHSLFSYILPHLTWMVNLQRR